jgi:hypothetical protein
LEIGTRRRRRKKKKNIRGEMQRADGEESEEEINGRRLVSYFPFLGGFYFFLSRKRKTICFPGCGRAHRPASLGE